MHRYTEIDKTQNKVTIKNETIEIEVDIDNEKIEGEGLTEPILDLLTESYLLYIANQEKEGKINLWLYPSKAEQEVYSYQIAKSIFDYKNTKRKSNSEWLDYGVKIADKYLKEGAKRKEKNNPVKDLIKDLLNATLKPEKITDTQIYIYSLEDKEVMGVADQAIRENEYFFISDLIVTDASTSYMNLYAIASEKLYDRYIKEEKKVEDIFNEKHLVRFVISKPDKKETLFGQEDTIIILNLEFKFINFSKHLSCLNELVGD